jgi:glycosyltransferase involved in cell wall biosynthesis
MLAQFFRPVIGGEERAVEDLSGALAARGHEVVVATLRVPGTPPEEEIGRVRVRRLEGLVHKAGVLFSENERRHLPPFTDPLLSLELARLVAEERPHVVHAHNWIVHSFVPVRRRTDAPLVLSLHDYSLVCAQKRMVRAGAVCSGPEPVKCLRCSVDHYGLSKGTVVAGGLRATARRLRKMVDLYLPVSRAVAERLDLGRRGLRYEIVPNLVPRANGAAPPPDPELLGRLPHGDFVLFLGDATEDKGARVLQQAYGELHEAPPLVLIGRPVDVDPASTAPNVMPLGPWPHATALEAVSRCAMLVAPSIVPETFGIGALEAMARGKPVVASRSGGYAELVVDGQTGRLVPPGDPAALRGAIAGLLSDAGAREAMGRAALERASLYSAELVAPRVEGIYLALCDERAGSSHGAR